MPLDTPGVPSDTPEQVLVRSRIIERAGGRFLLIHRDQDRKITGKDQVSAILPFTVAQRDGRPALVDLRIEFGWQDDKDRPDKEIRPLSLWRNTKTGALEFRLRQWPKGQMQVYGQDSVRPGDIVVIHEGPKKADLGNDMLGQYRHVAFCGGSGMAEYHDWSFLEGCIVVGMSDNDAPGRRAMEKIGAIVMEKRARAFGVVEWPEGTPAGYGLDDLYHQEVGGDEAEVLIEQAVSRSSSSPARSEAPAIVASDPTDLDGYEIHHDGLARAFADKHGSQLRYDHTRGRWCVWTGSHWKIEETELAFAWARDLCRSFGATVEKARTKNMIASVTTARAIEAFARTDRCFVMTSKDWDRDPFLMGTPDGVVDLKTGILRPADPADLISKITKVGPAAPGTPAPAWQRFLDDATRGDKELQRFLQQIVGYCLTGDVSEECLFFIYGPGGNGKGVFLRTIGAIMGDYATSAAMDTFTSSKGDKHPTDLAKLAGARMVTASETEAGHAWAEARIKELTGNERPISARFMRQDFFEYMPTFKLLFVGNHRPRLNNVDEAVRRRFNIIPFIFKPAEKDAKLKDKLEAEYSAILRWMIDGCLDWQRNGLVHPSSVEQATRDYFDTQDIYGRWKRECVEIDIGNDELWERATDLYHSWVQFCEDLGEKPGTDRDFGSKLTKDDILVRSKRNPADPKSNMRCRFGIRIIRDVNDPDWGR